jgi:choline dehydrogenase-like flavoprotein
MTPKLLMNSGIGDKRELAAAGIDVNYNHPMLGKTLQDHPMTYLILDATPELYASKL